MTLRSLVARRMPIRFLCYCAPSMPRDGRGGAPKPWMGWQLDREIGLLFEGTTAIGPEEALRRGQAIVSGLRPKEVGRLLKWASAAGVLDFNQGASSSQWVLRRYGVTFIPRGNAWKGWPGSVDIRRGLPTGGMSLEALASREAKRRERLRLSAIEWRLQAMRSRLSRCDPLGALPDALVAQDLPPVNTISGLLANLDDHIWSMQVWRVCEVLEAIERLPVRIDPVEDHGDAADALSDFRL